MFTIEKTMPKALGRAGRLTTAHGTIETPAFVAVGTKATVKALTPEQIKETGVQVVLANTYHLYLEPGEKIVKKAGGVGKFMGWNGPTMTDSGGFQVFSLGAAFGKKLSKIAKTREAQPRGERLSLAKNLVKIDEDGVSFRSYKDGSQHRFTPERSIEIQHKIGADIIFAFDECTSPDAPRAYQKEAMERTHRWAERSLQANKKKNPDRFTLSIGGSDADRDFSSCSLFGIVQGGRYEDLRKKSAKTIGKMNFDGFGIGGSFEKEDMGNAVRWVNEILPPEKPRHLLGIGEPTDLFAAVENGCDLFDCVAPTRQARNGSLYTRRGRLNITNSSFRADFKPIEKNCGCYTCTSFTRAYLAHLFHSNEILANTLASIHNLYFIVHIVKEMREAILGGSFSRLKQDFMHTYKN